jgi:hypothetical protein
VGDFDYGVGLRLRSQAHTFGFWQVLAWSRERVIERPDPKVVFEHVRARTRESKISLFNKVCSQSRQQILEKRW